MSDPDVKLDREILAKIHNQLKQQSDRMEYMKVRLDAVTNWIDMHTKHHMDNMVTIDQLQMIKDLEKKVDYLMKRKEEEIDAAGYCINPTPRFK